jgi:hypothetical protein
MSNITFRIPVETKISFMQRASENSMLASHLFKEVLEEYLKTPSRKTLEERIEALEINVANLIVNKN